MSDKVCLCAHCGAKDHWGWQHDNTEKLRASLRASEEKLAVAVRALENPLKCEFVGAFGRRCEEGRLTESPPDMDRCPRCNGSGFNYAKTITETLSLISNSVLLQLAEARDGVVEAAMRVNVFRDECEIISGNQWSDEALQAIVNMEDACVAYDAARKAVTEKR